MSKSLSDRVSGAAKVGVDAAKGAAGKVNSTGDKCARWSAIIAGAGFLVAGVASGGAIPAVVVGSIVAAGAVGMLGGIVGSALGATTGGISGAVDSIRSQSGPSGEDISQPVASQSRSQEHTQSLEGQLGTFTPDPVAGQGHQPHIYR